MQVITLCLIPSLLTESCFLVLLTCSGSQVFTSSFVSYRNAVVFFILKTLLLRSNQYKTVLHTYYTSHKNYIKAVVCYVESVVLTLSSLM